MNKYKKLAKNTIVFAIGSFGSKILVLFLTYLYTSNISSEDSSTKELLEITNFYLFYDRGNYSFWSGQKLQ